MSRPVVLVGLRCAGKSSVGRRLAAELGLPFVDLDDELAAMEGSGRAAGELLAEDGRSAVGTAHARSRRNEATHEGSQRPPLELLPLSGVHGR